MCVFPDSQFTAVVSRDFKVGLNGYFPATTWLKLEFSPRDLSRSIFCRRQCSVIATQETERVRVSATEGKTVRCVPTSIDSGFH